jgi:hypothetical protein
MAANGNGNGNGDGAVGQEAINTDIITLTRFITEEQAKHKEATGDFTYVPINSSSYDGANMKDLQNPVPQSSIRFQEHLILHPESNINQRACIHTLCMTMADEAAVDWSCWIGEYNR